MTDQANDFIELHDLISEGRYQEAETLYKNLLDENPEHAGLKDGLGKLYLTMGQKEKAEQYLGADYSDVGDDTIVSEEFKKIAGLIDSGAPKRDIVKRYGKLADRFPDHIGIKEGLRKYLDAV